MPTSQARRARTAHQVKLYRDFGLGKTKAAVVPPQVMPEATEREYARALLSIMARVREELAPLLKAMPTLLERAAADRRDGVNERADVAPRPRCHWCLGKGHLDERDARRVDDRVGLCPCRYRWRMDAGEGREIQALIDEAQAAMKETIAQRKLEALAVRFANETSTHQRRQLDKQLRAALGVEVLINDSGLANVIDRFAVENVALIKDIPARVMREVELATTRAVANGTLWPDLAVELEKRFGYGEDRARLIARDQVGKLYGQVNAQRQKNIGVRRFIWHTAGDERVRPEHVALNGETFEYDHPPSIGLPGEDINCRCWAEPVVDDIFEDIEDLPEGEAFEPEQNVPVRPVPRTSPAAASAEELLRAQNAILARQAAERAKLEAAQAEAAKVAEAKARRAPKLEAGIDTKSAFFDGSSWTPERAKLHSDYLAKVMKGVPSTEEPTVYMTGGGPASGKSFALLNNPETKIPKGDRAVHADPDAAKTELPEYLDAVDEGDVGAGSLAHEESAHMSQRAVKEGLQAGHDVVYDSSGDGGIEKLSRKVQGIRDAGAKRVIAHYATIDVEQAIARSDERGRQTGRFVPHDYLRAVHADVAKTSIAAMERGVYDELTIWDTGGSPSKIATYVKGKGVTVHDADAYARYLARGAEPEPAPAPEVPGQAGVTVHDAAAWETFRRRAGAAD